MDLNQDIASIFEQIKNLFDTETVVGQPIEIGNITLIPLISISFGSANGSGRLSRFKKANTGGGAGAVGKITPAAIVAVKDNELSVYSLTGKGLLDKLDDLMPLISTSLNADKTVSSSASTPE
ncbi:GerW family sporulation protein [Syntrophomonas palmitatica]|uniref:GerW family sporulation protein n=1 Tax=Syntrophomonas palmitatica TaxID=402877 RepID=UPI0006D1A77C|nr:spore germination protein GerW family protein [Syntrophomonas palmitatica]